MNPLSPSEESPEKLHDLCDSFEELWQEKGDVKLSLFWKQIQPSVKDWQDHQRKHLARIMLLWTMKVTTMN
jgi:hypothetical protein